MLSIVFFPLIYQAVISFNYLSFVFKQHRQRDPSNTSIVFFANLAQTVVYLPLLGCLIGGVAASRIIVSKKHSWMVVKGFVWWHVFQMISQRKKL